jgi:hypothetical protein
MMFKVLASVLVSYQVMVWLTDAVVCLQDVISEQIDIHFDLSHCVIFVS